MAFSLKDTAKLKSFSTFQQATRHNEKTPSYIMSLVIKTDMGADGRVNPGNKYQLKVRKQTTP